MSANGRTEVDDEGPTGMSALLKLCAFALADCTILIESESAKYLRAVHRTALELAVPNLFGSELGGFWLKADQIEQLKKLPDCYPANEIEFVKLAVEAYLLAQTEELKWPHVKDIWRTNHSEPSSTLLSEASRSNQFPR